MSYSSSDVIKYTSCSFHCLNSCMLKVRIRDGVIVDIEPDDTINPGVTLDDEYLSEDTIREAMVQRRPCAKAYAWRQQIYDPNRVLYPMKRVGERGEGKFERITWDEAIDTIARKLVETKEKYGPYSIMHNPYSLYGTCSFPLAPWFEAGIAGWQCHSSSGWHQPVLWVLGKDEPPYELPEDELNVLDSKLIVLWGLNPVTAWNTGSPISNFLRARKQGIPIIAVDSRYTMSGELLADQWIPIRPTTDVALIMAMANVLFKEDLCDNEFIDRYVEPEGLALWKAYVLGSSDGIDKTPQWAEEICGVPAQTIEGFARLYARSKPVNLLCGLTMGRQTFGENQVRALMYLQALTGNTAIKGGTSAAQTGFWFGQGGTNMSAIGQPAIDWQRKPGTYKAPCMMLLSKWPKSVVLREKLDKGEMTEAEYNNEIGGMADQPCPNIKMVFSENNNHGVSLPDTNNSIKALKLVDFYVCWSQSPNMLMAKYSDILLPMPYNAFEGGTVVRGDRWVTALHLPNFLMFRSRCIDMPGEVRSNDWVWTQIAKKLGLAEYYNPRMINVSHEEWNDKLDELHQEAYGKWTAKREIAAHNPPPWEEFIKKSVFQWPYRVEPAYSFKNDLEQGLNPFRGTESGKLEFFSKNLDKGGEFLSTHDLPAGSGRCYGPGNLPPMAEMTMGGRATFHHKDTVKHPLLMSSPHSYYRVHSWLDNSPYLRDDCYRHAVWMSVAEAKARGIKDDDLVRVYNDEGEMIVPAYVTSRILPGTCAIHHGAWYEPETRTSERMPDGVDRRGCPNLLTKNENLPETIIGNFQCKGLVQIEKWEGEA